MKVLLRHLGTSRNPGKKEDVELASMPVERQEIHWADRIVEVVKVCHFDLNDEDNAGYVACLMVEEA